MKKKFAIIDSATKPSRQKIIFDYLISKTDLDILVENISCEKKDFSDLIGSLRGDNFCGALVSMPFKDDAFLLADFSTERATSCKMANTLLFSSGRIYGDNTYGYSIVSDIENNIGITFAGKKLLIISSNNNIFSAIIHEMKKVAFENIYLASRSPEKVSKLLEENNQQSSSIFSKHIDDIENAFDIIINTTNVIFSEKNSPFVSKPWTKESLVYDINFSDKIPNYFLEAAKNEQATTSDGFGSCIEQAAEAISIWVGTKIKRETITELRNSISSASYYPGSTLDIKIYVDKHQAQRSL
ncbi:MULTISPECIES: shikimate dehydrogenase family protein [Candidatus Ichthyocystis]|uniref:Putative shikimate dehydrogenase n=1 Tax=Candidatus Ichthyocystis hellenicum TaxID=1561003 RepID=A0A0S4M7B2_9BURK|nr:MULTISPECIES: hypothetical protein [Ichthyocystis]CUT17284.1 putative shikimate dehydrogenase [Candidatus Ichthyocystis hellenicum]